MFGFQIQEKDHAQWWDAFAHEFFDDDAKMSFLLFDDQAPGHHHRYSTLFFWLIFNKTVATYNNKGFNLVL